MTRSLRISACLLALVAVPALAQKADKAVEKPLNVVIQSIKASKDDLALKQFAGEAQGKALLGDEWEKGTPEQRKEFINLFHRGFRAEAFPKIRDNFKNLAAVTTSNTEIKGDKAEADTLVVINHPLKKQELKLKFSLVKEGAAWKVVDVKVLGDSMLEGIRNDQIVPIYTDKAPGKGGWDGLLKETREFVARVEKKKS